MREQIDAGALAATRSSTVTATVVVRGLPREIVVEGTITLELRRRAPFAGGRADGKARGHGIVDAPARSPSSPAPRAASASSWPASSPKPAST